mmetsp:Transcript_31683/g.58190  ORF Transcript_31683/g.58190 Transcript_31683/m.58190 type:complete len:149 (-) Transcript_31683:84-530(-)
MMHSQLLLSPGSKCSPDGSREFIATEEYMKQLESAVWDYWRLEQACGGVRCLPSGATALELGKVSDMHEHYVDVNQTRLVEEEGMFAEKGFASSSTPILRQRTLNGPTEDALSPLHINWSVCYAACFALATAATAAWGMQRSSSSVLR